MNPLETLGRTLIIANPVAQSGAARAVAERLRRFLGMYLHDERSFDLVYTERSGHAVELAEHAAGYATVIALGGDGVVHEVACGLMRIPARQRPALCVAPVGSGNDFAMTIGMREMSSDTDLAQLLDCAPRVHDVGRIEFIDPEGTLRTEHYVQTFSVGLDAAIGIGTYELRRLTKLKGNPLYMASGLQVFGRSYRNFPLSARFDDGAEQALRTIIFAIQLGPTYGSGFRVCPAADPSDGLLDICYAQGPVPRAIALPIFLSAKNGHHVRSKHVTLMRAKSVELTFPEDGYPIQADGERLLARKVSVRILPSELTVLAPKQRGL